MRIRLIGDKLLIGDKEQEDGFAVLSIRLLIGEWQGSQWRKLINNVKFNHGHDGDIGRLMADDVEQLIGTVRGSLFEPLQKDNPSVKEIASLVATLQQAQAWLQVEDMALRHVYFELMQ